jgi:cysteine desulfurase/selenocysteine lyase
MEPWMGGGDMVETVSLTKTTYAPIPLKFEAGTPNFIGVAALGEAIRFVESIDKELLKSQEALLVESLNKGLEGVEGLKIYGKSNNKLPIFSFNVEGVHHADLAMLLDKMGVAVRSGMMCCEPLMTRFGLTGMVRASLLPYNSIEETQLFITALQKAIKMLK